MKITSRISLSVVTSLMLSLTFTSTSMAQQCPQPNAGDRPTVGLALGGGGARGFAHIGVLQVLEELRVPYHLVAGTSMGSLVGGMASVGMTPPEMQTLVETTDWIDLFEDGTDRRDLPSRRKQDDLVGLYGPKLGVGKDTNLLPAGLVAGQKILFMFETATSQRAVAENFDDLPIPFRAVSTNIVNGEMVVLKEGSLAASMRASMSVPGAFDPVIRDEEVLVDGGLVRNLPVDVVRGMGAEVVIAVDVGTPLKDADGIRNVLSIVEQMTSLMIVDNTEKQIATLGSNDVLIRPPLGDEITSAAFTKHDEAIAIGYKATMEQAPALRALSVSDEEYKAWRQGIANCVTGPPTIHFVELDNRSRFSDDVIRSLINVETGKPLDIEQLDYDVRQIYGLGFIRLAQYRVLERDEMTGVQISVVQDSRGTDFIETGLTLTGSGRGTNVNLQAGYLKTDVDDRGSEARVMLQLGNEFGLRADLYKYMNEQQRYIFNPVLSSSRRELLNFTDAGKAVSALEIDEIVGSVAVGREIARYATVSLGLRRYFGTVDTTIGLPTPSFHFDGGEWYAGAVYDRLDDLYLPTDGSRINLQYISSREQLGADENFEQILFNGVTTHSFGRHNLLLTATYNTTLDDDAPVYSYFVGGGFLNMSGYEPAELVGQHFGFVGAGYRYQIGQGGFMPGYIGTTVEYGNAAFDSEDVFGEGILNGSVYLGYGTPIGPLYLGYGWSQDRSGVIFLRLGTLVGSAGLARR